MASSSSVVFKVKYGDTLRRFNVQVDGVHPINLDVEGLRAKVRALFNFSTDAALTLTYVDEDNDVVTLGDNDDLHDVVKQGLNPVRINVVLDEEHKSGSIVDNGTTEASKLVPVVPLAIHAGIAEAMKSVPEPFLEALSKVSLDTASKAVSSNPILAELFESLMKTGKTYLNANPTAKNAATNTDSPADSSEKPKTPTAKRNGEKSKGPVKKAAPGGRDPKEMAKSVADFVKSMELKVKSPSEDADPQKVMGESSERKVPAADDKKKGKEISVESAVKSSDSFAKKLPVQDKISSVTPQATAPNQGNNKVGSMTNGSLPWNFCPAPLEQSSFSGVPPVAPSLLQPSQYPYHPRGGIFHRGVRCDGCGMFPITGPRFKSKVKDDFDLCYGCYTRLGENELDYMRIDFPVYRNAWSAYGAANPSVWGRPVHVPPPHTPPFLKRSAMKKAMKQARAEEQNKMEARLRLDSRFISDVNVLDGTIMAPKTPFTKIWLVRNNGKDSWPRGTQLLWIGGDKFSDVDAVEVKVSQEGLPVEGELEVAVDFTAPELPGRYVSYWRMASPSGQKFGQRIWVLIQVDASLADLESDNGLNLNYPPVSVDTDSPVPAAIVEPLVNVDVPVTGTDPVVSVSSPVARTEPLVDVISPVARTEPLVDVISPVARTEPFVDVSIPVARTEPLVSFNPELRVTLMPFEEPARPLLAEEPVSKAEDLIPPPTQPLYHSSSFPAGPSTSTFRGLSGELDSGVSYPRVTTAIPWFAFPAIPPTVSYPSVGNVADDAAPPSPNVSANLPEGPAAVPVNVEVGSEDAQKNDVEQILLKELEEMGFTQVDLNKEILRINKYDLERSVEDLCGYIDSDWDPLLEELEEMGFSDKVTNKRLLVKNNGSLKRVVMDLIAGEDQ